MLRHLLEILLFSCHVFVSAILFPSKSYANDCQVCIVLFGILFLFSKRATVLKSPQYGTRAEMIVEFRWFRCSQSWTETKGNFVNQETNYIRKKNSEVYTSNVFQLEKKGCIFWKKQFTIDDNYIVSEWNSFR